MPKAYLGLGGNLGDRHWHLAEAVRRLDQPPGLAVLTVSSVYESPAFGPVVQPDFLNVVVGVDTTLSPMELLAECLRLETALGRVRRERWGPRTVDLDVLLYDAVVLADEALTLPHPGMRERNFVLTLLAEIAPDLNLGGESVRALAARLGQTGLKKIGPLEWTGATTETPHHADQGV